MLSDRQKGPMRVVELKLDEDVDHQMTALQMRAGALAEEHLCNVTIQ